MQLENSAQKRIIQGLCIIIIVCFTAYLMMLFDLVHMYYDDFGYFCLSYPLPTPEYSSREYSLSDVVHYATGTHYQRAQGRATFLILGLGINAIAGFSGMKIILVAAIIAICIWSATQIKRDIDAAKFMAVLLPCVFYGLIGPYVHRTGTYWYIAAWYYLLPIPFFLLLYHLLEARMSKLVQCIFWGVFHLFWATQLNRFSY